MSDPVKSPLSLFLGGLIGGLIAAGLAFLPIFFRQRSRTLAIESSVSQKDQEIAVIKEAKAKAEQDLIEEKQKNAEALRLKDEQINKLTQQKDAETKEKERLKEELSEKVAENTVLLTTARELRESLDSTNVTAPQQNEHYVPGTPVPTKFFHVVQGKNGAPTQDLDSLESQKGFLETRIGPLRLKIIEKLLEIKISDVVDEKNLQQLVCDLLFVKDLSLETLQAKFTAQVFQAILTDDSKPNLQNEFKPWDNSAANKFFMFLKSSRTKFIPIVSFSVEKGRESNIYREALKRLLPDFFSSVITKAAAPGPK